MRSDEEEEQFQLAARAAERLVVQSRNHVTSSIERIARHLEHAAKSSPCGTDRMAALRGNHALAMTHRIEHVEAMSNALRAHLQGLAVLMQHDTFHPLPAIPIVRSIAEVSASCSWLLDPAGGTEARAARAYAQMFAWLDDAITAAGGDFAVTANTKRSQYVRDLVGARVRVERARDKKTGVALEAISLVTVGEHRAKVRFQHSQRIDAEIPLIAGQYAVLSGVAHGKSAYTSTSWETPATFARLIGVVALRSTEAWSSRVHGWVDITPAKFFNTDDYSNLIRSLPPEMRQRLDVQSADT